MQVLPSNSRHTHTIILLHGRDSTAKEFAPEFFESESSAERTFQDIFPNVRWVFPTAPRIPSKRFGAEMSQWFDMWSTEKPHEREQEQDLDGVIEQVMEVVEREATVVGAGNVVLGGISQGCVVAVHVLMRQKVRLCGFIGLSSWLAHASKLVKRTSEDALRTPVFLGHSKDDDVINVKYGEELRDALRQLGMDVRWQEYEDGGHWLNEPQGVNDVEAFLREVMNGDDLSSEA